MSVYALDCDAESFASWLESETAKYNKTEEKRPAVAMFIPHATTEQCASMAVEAMSHITGLGDCRGIALIACAIDDGKTDRAGIVTVDRGITDYSHGSFDSSMPVTLELSLNKAIPSLTKTDFGPISNKYLKAALPFAADIAKKAELPLIPFLYQKLDANALHTLLDALFREKIFVIGCGNLSHSMSEPEVKSNDSDTISKIISLDPRITDKQSSSHAILNALAILCDERCLRPKLIRYQTTPTEKFSNVAGYASLMYYR